MRIVAFALVFTFFIVATVVLIVFTMRWAIQRDRQRRLSQRDDGLSP
jgi:hypothetical protein